MALEIPVIRNGGGNGVYNNAYRQALTPQNKAENDRHLEMLYQEYMKNQKPARATMANPALLAAWKAEQDKKAKEFAVKNEPKRFLNPILRAQGFNGIPGDTKLRRDKNGNTAQLSSSWIGPVKIDMNGQRAQISLGGKPYSFAMHEIGGINGLKAALTSPSIGSYIATNWIGKLPSSKKNWGK